MYNGCEGTTAGTDVTSGNSATPDAFTTITKTGTGSVQWASDQASHGNRSMRVTGLTTSTTAYVRWGDTGSPLGGTQCTIRMYFRFASLGSAAADFIVVRNSAATIAAFSSNSSNVPQVKSAAGGIATGIGAFVVNNWYFVEMEVQVGTTTSNGTVRCRLYDADDPDTPVLGISVNNTTTDTGTTTLNHIRFGKNTSGANFDAWLDDLDTQIGTMTQPPRPGGSLSGGYVWNGSDWVQHQPWVWNGSTWIEHSYAEVV